MYTYCLVCPNISRYTTARKLSNRNFIALIAAQYHQITLFVLPNHKTYMTAPLSREYRDSTVGRLI